MHFRSRTLFIKERKSMNPIHLTLFTWLIISAPSGHAQMIPKQKPLQCEMVHLNLGYTEERAKAVCKIDDRLNMVKNPDTMSCIKKISGFFGSNDLSPLCLQENMRNIVLEKDTYAPRPLSSEEFFHCLSESSKFTENNFWRLEDFVLIKTLGYFKNLFFQNQGR